MSQKAGQVRYWQSQKAGQVRYWQNREAGIDGYESMGSAMSTSLPILSISDLSRFPRLTRRWYTMPKKSQKCPEMSESVRFGHPKEK